MGTVNKIVNVIVVILAIACVVVGTLLFNKREQLRFRGDKMAEVINKVSKVMDKESETDFSKKLLTDKLELDVNKDPKAEENKGKTLHLTNYENLEKVLGSFEKQVGELVKQRDELADAMNTISESLKIPETYGPAVFKSVKTYAEKKNSLIDSVVKVNTRDEAIVDQIVSSAKQLGFDVNASSLKDLENFRPALNDFGTKVESFKKRLDTYSAHITKLCSIMEIAPPAFAGEDYASALSASEQKFQEKRSEFDTMRRELLAVKDDLEQTKAKLARELEAKAELEKKIAAVETEVAQYKRILEGDFDVSKGPPQEEDLLRKLVGKVVEVNDKWNFVIIDLGEHNKVPTKAIKKELFVGLPVGRIMKVSRGDEPVAEIKVVRVNQNCSVADIVPGKKWKDIQPGDIVRVAIENE